MPRCPIAILCALLFWTSPLEPKRAAAQAPIAVEREVVFQPVAPTTRTVTRDPIVFELRAGDHDRQGVPIGLELPWSLENGAGPELIRLDTGKSVPVQVDPGPPARATWMLNDRLAAGQSRRYRLVPGPALRKSKSKNENETESKNKPTVHADDDGQRLMVRLGDRPVLAYQYAVMPCPDREQPWFDRGGFLHPVYSPAGQVLTDAMPPDHYHQHGIMFPWTNTTFEGRPVDFWNSKVQQGTVEHVKLANVVQGEVFAAFDAVLVHVDQTAPDGPKNVLRETWRVHVFNRADGFLFDLDSTQTCAGQSPLRINEYHYGAMAFRGARAWFEAQTGDFLTSEGKTRADGNHTRPRWVDAHGRQNGREAGVTVFCDPGNFRFPQPVRLHPKKPYFCWAPMVLGEFSIEPGTPYVSKYRYFVHDGPLEPRQAETLWHALANPPTVHAIP